jgi:hypothetical protein
MADNSIAFRADADLQVEHFGPVTLLLLRQSLSMT